MNQNSKAPIVSIIGRSGAGKTTFLTKLVAELKRRGYRVAVLKHHGRDTRSAGNTAAGLYRGDRAQVPSTETPPASREVDFDTPGKDTWRHSQAGADTVVISGHNQMAMYHRLTHELTPDELAGILPRPVDIILTEGHTSAGKPAIEIMRRALGTQSIAIDSTLLAIVTDAQSNLQVPQFEMDDARGVATLLEHSFNLTPADPETRRLTEH